MNRRSFLKSANAAGLAIALPSVTFAATEKKPAAAASPNPNTILLKDYRPQSIFKVLVSHIARAKYPIIDMHSHPYPKNDAEIITWLKILDECYIEQPMVLTMSAGNEF